MTKKRNIFVLIAILLLTVICGCDNEESLHNASSSEAATDKSDDYVYLEIEKIADIEASDSNTSSTPSNIPTVSVAIIGDVSKQILGVAQSTLEGFGYGLDIQAYDDYDAVNDAVVSGVVDASLCINEAYMDSYNTINGTDLVISSREYFEPLAIFAARSLSLKQCPSGAVIALPQGEIDYARALFLLEQKGLIEVNADSGYQASFDDIVTNTYGIKLETYDPSEGFPDSSRYDYVISGINYALLSGKDSESMLGYENRNSDLVDLFTINLVTTSRLSENMKILRLIDALDSEAVKDFIESTYYGSVVDYR